MVIEHDFDIPHDLGIAAMGFFSGLGDVGGLRVESAGGLGVEHEGNGEQPLDPFCTV